MISCKYNLMQFIFYTCDFELQIFLGYHPRRCHESLCLDIFGARHGTVAGMTFNWSRLHVRDCVHALGGVKILLPLFAFPQYQVTRKVSVTEVAQQSGCATADTMTRVSTAGLDAPSILTESILLLLAFLKDRDVHRRAFAESHGFSIMRVLLESAPADILRSARVTDAMMALHDTLWNCPILEPSFIKEILFHIKLWRDTSFNSQIVYFIFLLDCVRRRSSLYRALIGVQELVDAFSWYSSISRPTSANKFVPPEKIRLEMLPISATCQIQELESSAKTDEDITVPTQPDRSESKVLFVQQDHQDISSADSVPSIHKSGKTGGDRINDKSRLKNGPCTNLSERKCAYIRGIIIGMIDLMVYRDITKTELYAILRLLSTTRDEFQVVTIIYKHFYFFLNIN